MALLFQSGAGSCKLNGVPPRKRSRSLFQLRLKHVAFQEAPANEYNTYSVFLDLSMHLPAFPSSLLYLIVPVLSLDST